MMVLIENSNTGLGYCQNSYSLFIMAMFLEYKEGDSVEFLIRTPCTSILHIKMYTDDVIKIACFLSVNVFKKITKEFFHDFWR